MAWIPFLNVSGITIDKRSFYISSKKGFKATLSNNQKTDKDVFVESPFAGSPK